MKRLCMICAALLCTALVLLLTQTAIADKSATPKVDDSTIDSVLCAAVFPSNGVYIVSVQDGKISMLKKLEDASKAQSESATPAPIAQKVEEQKGPFTSVIIDARGFGIVRDMSPKVRRADGSEVWGTLKTAPDYVIETGIVSYVKTMEAAKKSSRCGDNPFLIKATQKAASAFDAVISDDDAKRLLEENSSSKFLEKCKVVFLID